jgi:hypothetical protein
MRACWTAAQVVHYSPCPSCCSAAASRLTDRARAAAGTENATTRAACSDWLKQVQAYVLYLQKQLAALSATADAQQPQDAWLNLAHEMRVSFQNVVSEVKSSGVTVSRHPPSAPQPVCCSASWSQAAV